MNVKRARAMIAIGASSAEMDRGLREARRKLAAFQREEAKKSRERVQRDKKVRGVLGGTAKFGLSALATGFGVLGAGGISQATDDIRDFERNLTRFQITAGQTPTELAGMRQAIRDISSETAVSSADILAGAQTYVDLTGDVKGAVKAMAAFANVAQASGSSVSDIATATAALQQSMKLNPGDIEAAFSGLIVQGKKGAVSLKDFAGELSTLAPQFAQFAGGSGLTGIREMGSAFQVIRQGAGSAGEAATQFQAVMGELVASHKELGKVGVRVFDPKTNKLNNFSDIMSQIAENKLLKDPRLVAKIFGRKESQAAVRTIQGQIQAMRDLATAAQDTGAVQRDVATYLSSDAGKMDAAFNNIKLAIAEAFTPERIAAFANALIKVGDMLAKIVGYIDKTVQYADDLRKRMGLKTVQERTDDIYSKASAFAAKTEKEMPTSRDSKIAYAQKLRQDAANLYTKPGGYTPDDEVQIGVNQKLADDLIRQADAQLYQNGGFDQQAFGQRYAMAAPDKFEKYDVELVKPIVEAIQNGFSTAGRASGGGAPNFGVFLDGSKVGKGVDNAAHQRGAKRP